jgi:hypothetical protein
LHPPDIILINVYTCIYRCACACTNDWNDHISWFLFFPLDVKSSENSNKNVFVVFVLEPLVISYLLMQLLFPVSFSVITLKTKNNRHILFLADLYIGTSDISLYTHLIH